MIIYQTKLLRYLLSLIVLITLGTLVKAQTNIVITDISPNRSTLDEADPDGASGGRINGLAVTPNNNQIFYAASEWGGLFKSIDEGRTWNQLEGHVPVATWDVEVDLSNPERVFATSFYDGRVSSRAGINVSTDSGNTWIHPITAVPPQGFCNSEVRREEPSAFGIAIDPDSPSNVYIGTNCGLAISTDSGLTWRYVDPTPDPRSADEIWDVVVHDDGIIDLCGADGHQRSIDGGTNWTTAGQGQTPLFSGFCSIAVSPDESYVLFAVVGTTIFESNDGGQSWAANYTNPSPQGRIPFIATSQREGNTFDLWFGDIGLYRATCTTPNPASPGGGQRCEDSSQWIGSFTRQRGGHDDVGDIAFDSQVDENACPVLFANDGGVYFNTLTVNPSCHDPFWEQPIVTPHALWNWDLAGAQQPGASQRDLYFGNQDTGVFSSRDAGNSNQPSWINQDCCDGFDVAADPERVLWTVCCWPEGRSTRLFISDPGMGGGSQINTYPSGNLRRFQQLDSIINFGPDDYAIITSDGFFITENIAANPIVWTELGTINTPFNACAIQATINNTTNTPTFFVKSGGCDGDNPGAIWAYNGTSPNNTWEQLIRAGNGLFVGVYAVDPNNPDRIFASDLTNRNSPEMIITNDGGTTWQNIPNLDNLMTGGGIFRYQNQQGPTRFTGFGGYPQPTLVAFDPFDADILLAGGADSGVFLSLNGGTNWQLITDPFNPQGSGIPHIPRPRHVHFDHNGDNDLIHIYIGTQGRGAWRIGFFKNEDDLSPTLDISFNGVSTNSQPIAYVHNLFQNTVEYLFGNGPHSVDIIQDTDYSVGGYPLVIDGQTVNPDCGVPHLVNVDSNQTQQIIIDYTCSDTGEEDEDNTLDPRDELVICEVGHTSSVSPSGAAFPSVWLEVFNPTNQPINLSNYQLRSLDRIWEEQLFSLPNVLVPQNSYALIRGKFNDILVDGPEMGLVFVDNGDRPNEKIYPYWYTDGSNHSGFVELIKAGQSIDYVRWGEQAHLIRDPLGDDNQNAWSGNGIPFRGISNTDSFVGGSFARDSSCLDMNQASDWKVHRFSTPGGINDVPANAVDEDFDGIPDSAEEEGGTFAGIDLYRDGAGAQKGQKDIFIEVDVMEIENHLMPIEGVGIVNLGVRLREEALDKITAIFDTKRVLEPTRPESPSLPIKVHFDLGTFFESGKYNLGQGNSVVPFAKSVRLAPTASWLVNDPQFGLQQNFYFYKHNFMSPARLPIFHYMLMGTTENANGQSGVSGRAELGGNDILILLGGDPIPNPEEPQNLRRAGGWFFSNTTDKLSSLAIIKVLENPYSDKEKSGVTKIISVFNLPNIDKLKGFCLKILSFFSSC